MRRDVAGPAAASGLAALFIHSHLGIQGPLHQMKRSTAAGAAMAPSRRASSSAPVAKNGVSADASASPGLFDLPCSVLEAILLLLSLKLR